MPPVVILRRELKNLRKRGGEGKVTKLGRGEGGVRGGGEWGV